jgi:hypothetical protein
MPREEFIAWCAYFAIIEEEQKVKEQQMKYSRGNL